MKVSVILPCYRERKTIARCIGEVVRVLTALKLDYEVVVVDDGSDDDTYQMACISKRGNSCIKIVRYVPNMGKAYAVKVGFQNSVGEIVVFLDSDLSMHPNQLSYYLTKLGRNDGVIASKRHPKSDIIYPLHRRILSKIFNLIVRAMFKLPFSDTQCGFKIFKRHALEDVMPRLRIKRYVFDVELLVNLYKRGFKIVEAPITLRHGEESVDLRDILGMSLDLLVIFYRLNFVKTYD